MGSNPTPSDSPKKDAQMRALTGTARSGCFHSKKKCELDTGIAAKSIGELGGIRTLDLQIKSPLLYQLSYELPFNNYPDRA